MHIYIEAATVRYSSINYTSEHSIAILPLTSEKVLWDEDAGGIVARAGVLLTLRGKVNRELGLEYAGASVSRLIVLIWNFLGFASPLALLAVTAAKYCTWVGIQESGL